MRRLWRVGLLLAVLTAESTANSVLYHRIFEGEAVAPAGTYETFYASWLRCSAMCAQHASCIVWSWDSVSQRCQVYSSVAPQTDPEDATATTKTFTTVNGFFFVNTADGSQVSWQGGADLCEERNGVIAFTGHEEIKLLLQTIRRQSVWMGLTRATSTSPWVDHNGDAPSDLYWAPTEPEGDYLCAYYRFSDEGLYTIWPTMDSDLPALCTYV